MGKVLARVITPVQANVLISILSGFPGWSMVELHDTELWVVSSTVAEAWMRVIQGEAKLPAGDLEADDDSDEDS